LDRFRIAIIGGSGFVGSSLARHLRDSFTIRVLDKNPIPRDLEGSVDFRGCDIRKYDDVERGIRDVDIVIHMAIIQIPLINGEKRLGYEVNLLGTQNVCEAVDRSPSVKGLILSGTWHVFGERGLNGIIDEEFGYRPDRIEDRARIYALSKIAQETIVRFYDEMSEKTFGVIRQGTVLGEGMPEKTATNVFISRGLKGENITPYEHSMYRPMLFADINDVCRAYEIYTKKILSENCEKGNSLMHIVNLFWPEPITIIELATMVRDLIVKCSEGKMVPKIEIVGGNPNKLNLYSPREKELIRVQLDKAKTFLGIENLISPEQSIERIIKGRMIRGN